MTDSKPHPGHDEPHVHGPECHHGADDAVVRARHICETHGLKLTSMRERVLELLAGSSRPLGAYELMDLLADDGKRPAPISVYRALDFLLEHGLAHRIESRNAFVACSHVHAGGEVVVFLLCEQCGAVSEATGTGIGQRLAALAREAGFRARAQVLEVAGTCARCQAEPGDAAHHAHNHAG